MYRHAAALRPGVALGGAVLVGVLTAVQARINGHKLRNGFARPEDQKAIVKACSEMSGAPLYIDDSPSRNVTEISATARARWSSRS